MCRPTGKYEQQLTQRGVNINERITGGIYNIYLALPPKRHSTCTAQELRGVNGSKAKGVLSSYESKLVNVHCNFAMVRHLLALDKFALPVG